MEEIRVGDTVKVMFNKVKHGYKIGNKYKVTEITILEDDNNHELILDEVVAGCFIRVEEVELIKNKK